MSIPTVERDAPHRDDDRPGILIRSPYSERFVERIKADIPKPDRYFDPDDGGWWVDEEHQDAAIALVCLCYGGVTILDEVEGDVYLSASGERCAQERLF